MKKTTKKTEKKANKKNAYKQNAKQRSMLASSSGIPLIILMAGPFMPNIKVAMLIMPNTWAGRIQKVNQIYDLAVNNPNVTFSPTDLGTLLNKITNLEDAQEKVRLKLIGAAGFRDVAWLDLFAFLKFEWKALVQNFANANVAMAVTIIESCGYNVKGTPKRNKGFFSVEFTNIPGQCLFKINAHAMFLTLADQTGTENLRSVVYEQSLDGIHWTVVQNTSGALAKAYADGFIQGTKVQFRARGFFSRGRVSQYFFSGSIFII